MWIVESITIHKEGPSTGEAFVKIVDEEGNDLLLNKLTIDLTDGADPVKIIKFKKVPVIAGILVDQLKEMITGIFEEMRELEPGMYVADRDGLSKL